jgi:hypothetical protein
VAVLLPKPSPPQCTSGLLKPLPCPLPKQASWQPSCPKVLDQVLPLLEKPALPLWPSHPGQLAIWRKPGKKALDSTPGMMGGPSLLPDHDFTPAVSWAGSPDTAQVDRVQDDSRGAKVVHLLRMENVRGDHDREAGHAKALWGAEPTEEPPGMGQGGHGAWTCSQWKLCLVSLSLWLLHSFFFSFNRFYIYSHVYALFGPPPPPAPTALHFTLQLYQLSLCLKPCYTVF